MNNIHTIATIGEIGGHAFMIGRDIYQNEDVKEGFHVIKHKIRSFIDKIRLSIDKYIFKNNSVKRRSSQLFFTEN